MPEKKMAAQKAKGPATPPTPEGLKLKFVPPAFLSSIIP
jgi:hypothetical protein